MPKQCFRFFALRCSQRKKSRAPSPSSSAFLLFLFSLSPPPRPSRSRSLFALLLSFHARALTNHRDSSAPVTSKACRQCPCVGFSFCFPSPLGRRSMVSFLMPIGLVMPSLSLSTPFPTREIYRIRAAPPPRITRKTAPKREKRQRKNRIDLALPPTTVAHDLFHLSPPQPLALLRPAHSPLRRRQHQANRPPPRRRPRPTPSTSRFVPPSRETSSEWAPTSCSSPHRLAGARATRRPPRSATGTSGAP